MSSATNKRYMYQVDAITKWLHVCIIHEMLTQWICNYFFNFRDIPSNLKLKDVYTALYDTTDQWFDIGLQLDIDSDDLERIDAKFQNNKERLRNMLTVRLAQGDLTWDQIIEALENRTIGQKVIADEIKANTSNHKLQLLLYPQ